MLHDMLRIVNFNKVSDHHISAGTCLHEFTCVHFRFHTQQISEAIRGSKPLKAFKNMFKGHEHVLGHAHSHPYCFAL
jgi:hypothetical protein